MAKFLLQDNIMKSTANIHQFYLLKEDNTTEFYSRIRQIVSTKWKLKSIFETGLVTDEAKFKDVDVIFSRYHIYAVYGNRVDKFKMNFVTHNTFRVNIEGVDVKCRIKELDDQKFVFHVDFSNSYFIVELEAA